MAVGEDVGGFQQLVMAEPADDAALLVGVEYALAKSPLVQALADHRGHILPPRGQRRRVIELPGGRGPDLVIDRHDEAQGVGMVLEFSSFVNDGVRGPRWTPEDRPVVDGSNPASGRAPRARVFYSVRS